MIDPATLGQIIGEVWTPRMRRSAQLSIRHSPRSDEYIVTATRSAGDRTEGVGVLVTGPYASQTGVVAAIDNAIAHTVAGLVDLTDSEALTSAEQRRTPGQARALRDPRMTAWLDGARRAGWTP